MHLHHRGFTLLELMITVAVIGVLAAVAYPAYTDAVLKGRRAQARTSLLELLQQQERYMTQFNCYLPFTTSATFTATATAACDPEAAPPSDVPFKVFVGENQASAVYRLSASACIAEDNEDAHDIPINECITLTATPLRSDPHAGDLVLNSYGVKSCTGSAASTNPSLCWP